MTRAGIERRVNLRIKETFPVQFRFLDTPDASIYKAVSRDLGAGGMCIAAATLAKGAIGERLGLELHLPGEEAPVRLKGEKVWLEAREADRITGMGVRFTDLMETEKIRLNSYVLERLTEVTAPCFERLRGPGVRLNDKEMRNLAILGILRKQGPLSKAEISQAIGLNIGTVTNYIDDYIKNGLVYERGLDASTGGRRPSLLELNSEFGFIIGIDILQEKNLLVAVLVDFATHIISRLKKEISPTQELKVQLAEAMFELIASSRVSRSKLLGVGIGFLGSPEDATELQEFIKEQFNLPSLCVKKPLAAIFAEKWSNSELDRVKNILYVGSDNICSMVMEDSLHLGATGNAGMIGIRQVRGEEQQLRCWLGKDCILNYTHRLLNADNVEEVGSRLGVKLACLVNLLDPEVIVLGDVDEEYRDAFLNAVKVSLKKWSFEEQAKVVYVVPSRLKEEGVAIGAAALATQDIFAQV